MKTARAQPTSGWVRTSVAVGRQQRPRAAAAAPRVGEKSTTLPKPQLKPRQSLLFVRSALQMSYNYPFAS